MNNLMGAPFLLFVVLVMVHHDQHYHQSAMAAPIRQSAKRHVKVGVELDESSSSSMDAKTSDGTTKPTSTYKLEFTNLSYKLVCQVKFRIEVPKTATMAKYWNMVPISGSKDEYTLPIVQQLYPGRAFADAGIKLNGVGMPKITVVDTIDVLSTKQCPNVPMLQ